MSSAKLKNDFWVGGLGGSSPIIVHKLFFHELGPNQIILIVLACIPSVIDFLSIG